MRTLRKSVNPALRSTRRRVRANLGGPGAVSLPIVCLGEAIERTAKRRRQKQRFGKPLGREYGVVRSERDRPEVHQNARVGGGNLQ